jgi:Nif-specific regulatory protein
MLRIKGNDPLFEVSQRLIGSKELKDDLSPVLKLVVEHLKAERCFLTIFNRQTNNILLKQPGV